MTLAAYEPPWIAPWATPGVGWSGFHGSTAASPTTKISGWPGMVRSGSTTIRPDRSVGAPVASATFRTKLDARMPAAHSTVRAGIVSVAPSGPTTRTLSSSMSDDARPGPDLDPEMLELALRGRGAVGRIGRQDPVHRLDQDDPRLARADRPEVAPERVVGDLTEGAGQLDAGRSAADQDERHPGAPSLGLGLALGGLEGDQDPPPDLGRVLERLEAGREQWPTRGGRSSCDGRRSRRSACRRRSARRRPSGPRAARGRGRSPRRG